jgi:8-oxo-dGTP pyrophosphatase MutT (NUDIX family)
VPREGIIVFLEASARRIAVQLRTGLSFGGMWGLFGGWIEPGETRDQAVIREIHEELSISLESSRLSYLCLYPVPEIDALAHLYHYALAEHELDAAALGEGADFRLATRLEISTLNLAWFYRSYLDWYWNTYLPSTSSARSG